MGEVANTALTEALDEQNPDVGMVLTEGEREDIVLGEQMFKVCSMAGWLRGLDWETSMPRHGPPIGWDAALGYIAHGTYEQRAEDAVVLNAIGIPNIFPIISTVGSRRKRVLISTWGCIVPRSPIGSRLSRGSPWMSDSRSHVIRLRTIAEHSDPVAQEVRWSTLSSAACSSSCAGARILSPLNRAHRRSTPFTLTTEEASKILPLANGNSGVVFRCGQSMRLCAQ